MKKQRPGGLTGKPLLVKNNVRINTYSIINILTAASEPFK
jgi:hypothetical protein